MIPEMISCFISKQIETDHSYFRYRFTDIDSRNLLHFPLINIHLYVNPYPRDQQRNRLHRVRNESNDISPTNRSTQNYDSVSRPPAYSLRYTPYLNNLFPYSIWKRSRKEDENHGRARFTRLWFKVSRCVHQREAYAPRDMHYPRHNPRRMIYKSSESRFGTKQKR